MTSSVDAPVSATPQVVPASGAVHSARRWRRLLWALAAALIVVAVTFISQAAVYQPLTTGGGMEGTGVVGAGTGQITSVNNLDGQVGQYFVPPTATSFYISFGVFNQGPHAVTILSASTHPPEVGNPPPWPLAVAGATYTVEYPASSTTRPLRNASVAPGETLLVRLRVRMVDRCYVANGWTGASTVYLAERYLTFTHEVPLKLTTPFVFHEPEPRGVGGATCPPA